MLEFPFSYQVINFSRIFPSLFLFPWSQRHLVLFTVCHYGVDLSRLSAVFEFSPSPSFSNFIDRRFISPLALILIHHFWQFSCLTISQFSPSFLSRWGETAVESVSGEFDDIWSRRGGILDKVLQHLICGWSITGDYLVPQEKCFSNQGRQPRKCYNILQNWVLLSIFKSFLPICSLVLFLGNVSVNFTFVFLHKMFHGTKLVEETGTHQWMVFSGCDVSDKDSCRVLSFALCSFPSWSLMLCLPSMNLVSILSLGWLSSDRPPVF